MRYSSWIVWNIHRKLFSTNRFQQEIPKRASKYHCIPLLKKKNYLSRKFAVWYQTQNVLNLMKNLLINLFEYVGYFIILRFFLVNEYLLCFSIKSNWEKFLQPVTYPDYVRLRSFQAVKTFCMLGIILGHTVMSLIEISTINPDFYEDVSIDISI